MNSNTKELQYYEVLYDDEQYDSLSENVYFISRSLSVRATSAEDAKDRARFILGKNGEITGVELKSA